MKVKIKKSHLKELIKQSIFEFLSEEGEEEKQNPPEKEDEKPMTNIPDDPFEKDDKRMVHKIKKDIVEILLQSVFEKEHQSIYQSFYPFLI